MTFQPKKSLKFWCLWSVPTELLIPNTHKTYLIQPQNSHKTLYIQYQMKNQKRILASSGLLGKCAKIATCNQQISPRYTPSERIELGVLVRVKLYKCMLGTTILTPQACLQLKSYIACLLCACAHSKFAQMHVRLMEVVQMDSAPQKKVFRHLKHVCSSLGSKVILRAYYVLVHIVNVHRCTLGFWKWFRWIQHPKKPYLDTSNMSVACLVQKLYCVLITCLCTQ